VLPLEAPVDVVAGEGEEIADVQPLRGRVWEHHQRVVRPHAGGDIGVVRAVALPALLPLLFDRGRVVGVRGRLCGFSHSSQNVSNRAPRGLPAYRSASSSAASTPSTPRSVWSP